MMHVIRLHGPWNATLVPRVTPADSESADAELEFGFRAPAGLAEQMPNHFVGKARIVRLFNRPTGIDAAETLVDLAFTLSHSARIQLNAETVAELPAGEHSIPAKSQLQSRNELIVELDVTGGHIAPKCDARLVIHASRRESSQ